MVNSHVLGVHAIEDDKLKDGATKLGFNGRGELIPWLESFLDRLCEFAESYEGDQNFHHGGTVDNADFDSVARIVGYRDGRLWCTVSKSESEYEASVAFQVPQPRRFDWWLNEFIVDRSERSRGAWMRGSGGLGG